MGTDPSPSPRPPAGARVPREFAVLGFGSTHEALDAESLLLDMGIQVVPIPAPRSLGSLCGIALRLHQPAQGTNADRLRAIRRIELLLVGGERQPQRTGALARHLANRALARNLAVYGPFAATERVLMAAVKAFLTELACSPSVILSIIA